MRLVLRLLAKRDLAEARRWYEDKQPGLGDDFGACVDATFATICAHPRIFPRVDSRVRRAKINRFPFGVFYLIEGDTIRVLAVLHHARSPATWKTRQ